MAEQHRAPRKTCLCAVPVAANGMSETTATGAAPGLLLCISAPSGAGKTSLVKALIEADANVAVSVSHTTRPRRSTEIDGVNYHFVDAERFAGMIDSGQFLEHAQVFGHFYGTSVQAVEGLRSAGKDVVLEIDWQGAAQIRCKAADVISIFVLPPSKATLQERLVARGEDSSESMAERLEEARTEVAHFKDFDYLLVNDEFAAALADLQAIVRAERLRTSVLPHREERLIADLLS